MIAYLALDRTKRRRRAAYFKRAYDIESLPVPDSDNDPMLGVHRTAFGIVLSLQTTTL